MRPFGNRPTLAELSGRQSIANTGLDQYSRNTMGMSAKRLQGHLAIADRLLQNDTSVLKTAKVRNWLYAQAEASGHTREQVDQVIAEVMDAPSPEARVQRYAVALSGDPGAAQRGLQLAQSYQKEFVAEHVNTRLQQQDQQLRRSGSTFHALPEDDRIAKAREESGSLRQALETAAASSGLTVGRPQSLQDYQVRAQLYANNVASRLEDTERRRAAGEKVDLRETIENAWMTDKALQAKADVGLPGGASIGDVVERADVERSAAESLMSDVENQ